LKISGNGGPAQQEEESVMPETDVENKGFMYKWRRSQKGTLNRIKFMDFDQVDRFRQPASRFQESAQFVIRHGAAKLGGR
jgi:hypothetical protein